MNNHKAPLVDEANPFYIPSLSAAQYVDSLRHRLHRARAVTSRPQDDALLYSFARILDQALFEDQHVPADQFDGRSSIYSRLEALSGPSSGDDSYSLPAWERQTRSNASQEESSPRRYQYTPGIPRLHLKRKRPSSSESSDSFNDLRGPIRRGRSSQSVHTSSFELSGKDEKLDYFPPNESSTSSYYVLRNGLLDAGPVKQNMTLSTMANRVKALEDELYGPAVSTDSSDNLKSFIIRLDALLPGIRFKETLFSIPDLTVQGLADVLGRKGNLNASILNAFRKSNVKSLSLTSSMTDSHGLNLAGRHILSVFSKPNSFLHLSTLDMKDVPLDDSDLIQIHHLPELRILHLDSTGIGNEAVYLLTTLKHALTHLSIPMNPRIDDDAVPALILFSLLNFLSIRETGIGMDGLRRLATTIHDEGRDIDVEMPDVCDTYMMAVKSLYLVKPLTPLITSPSACSALSSIALKRNLAAHAAVNPEILTGGTKKEMTERLKDILETRKMDIMVSKMIWEDEDGD